MAEVSLYFSSFLQLQTSAGFSNFFRPAVLHAPGAGGGGALRVPCYSIMYFCR